MISITEIVKGIFKIGPLDTHSRTPWTAPFLVVGSERAAIVEPGEGGQALELMEGIKEIGVGLDRIAYIIASHIHLHHVHSINMLLPKMPQAKVVVHQHGAPHLVEPTRLNASTLQVWGKDSGCPQISPVPQDRIWGVSGGEVIDLGGRELEIIETLGHSPHHISIFDRLTRVLFPGDAVGVIRLGCERANPDIRPPLFELEIAEDSLRRLRALKPSLLLVFGHNALSHSPDKTLRWAEEDIRTVERIVRESMKQKISSLEIGRRVHEYYDSVGIGYPATGAEGRRGGMMGPMYRYLQKQDTSLETPR